MKHGRDHYFINNKPGAALPAGLLEHRLLGEWMGGKQKEEKKMTREEAIRILASSCIPGSKQTEALETLIPELRESEDERIRKEIIHYILYKANGVSEKQEHEWIAYLEKQAEEKFDLIDRNFRRGREVGYREGVADTIAKQKENPKSADSIPSNCVSDAKCEDRWHKVTDSLPDNGRLVLAKDCLGYILLER